MSCGYIIDLIPYYQEFGLMWPIQWLDYYWINCYIVG